MAPLRGLTILLVVLVLAPAGVLAGLGVYYGSRLDQALGRQIGQDLDAAELHLRQALPDLARDLDRTLALPVERAAERTRRDLPRGGTVHAPVAPAVRVRTWRLADASGRTIHPRGYDPDDVRPGTWEARLEELRRRADRLLHAERDPDAARAVWSEARGEVRAPDLSAAIEAEEALLRLRLDPRPAAAAEAWRELARRRPGVNRPPMGRSALRLLLVAAESDPALASEVRRGAWSAAIDDVPLTDEERRRARALAGAPADPAPPPEGRVVVSADVLGGARLEAAYAVEDVWTHFGGQVERAFERFRGVRAGARPSPASGAPVGRRRAPDVPVLEIEAPAWGGRTAVYALRHEGLARVAEERARRVRWIVLGVVPLFGAIFVGVFLVRRAVRREVEARRLRDDFVANVSHELRTPLTSVCLHAEMLAEEDVPPDRRRSFARVVEAEGARLMTLVDDLLDFAALARGRRRLEPEPIDLGEAVRRAVAPFETLARREGAEVSAEVSSPAPVARADAHGVSRILANLVANAWKHGRPSRSGGPGRIRVRAYDAPDGPVVDVEDDGPGIPAKERDAVFERFRRGSGAARSTGAGLGLALSRDLARAMGGDLVLVPGDGATRFRLTLPRPPEVP